MYYIICERGWHFCYEMSRGEGVKKWSNLRYVIYEWPLNTNYNK